MERDENDEESTSERILRLQDLWDEIAASPDGIELTTEQRLEFERRLGDHRRNPRRYTTWEELRAELERDDRAGD
jgi:putative addiction module component (TIGR02574 family)